MSTTQTHPHHTATSSSQAAPQLREHSDQVSPGAPQHGRGRKAPKNTASAIQQHRMKSHSTAAGSGEMREREAGDVDRQINRLAEDEERSADSSDEEERDGEVG
ncbi:MAG TPA: hypothetical protein VHD32_02915 [Candidatus Didemnitutus sp.]|nr:hypothetical protein [Candidatus Didemnitutus sp.]